MNRLKTTEEYIRDAVNVHGNIYNYEKVDYRGGQHPIDIICPYHGVFSLKASNHVHNGTGCKQCVKEQYLKKWTEIFLNQGRKLHGDKYDYSKVRYVNTLQKVIIICPIHGEFYQSPQSHMKGCGCRKCYTSSVTNLYTTESYVALARKTHGDKYDYSKVLYTGVDELVKIVCNTHGEFQQRARNHIQGQGCRKCCFESQRSTTEVFIQKACQVHGNMFDYSNSVYVGSAKKITIRCKSHGPFEQDAGAHLQGYGCPTCRESRGERLVVEILEQKKIP
jgi:hypothetical protein